MFGGTVEKDEKAGNIHSSTLFGAGGMGQARSFKSKRPSELSKLDMLKKQKKIQGAKEQQKSEKSSPGE